MTREEFSNALEEYGDSVVQEDRGGGFRTGEKDPRETKHILMNEFDRMTAIIKKLKELTS